MRSGVASRMERKAEQQVLEGPSNRTAPIHGLRNLSLECDH
jgi:hypothetical protein